MSHRKAIDDCNEETSYSAEAMEAERQRCYALGVAAERERWVHVFDGWRVLQALTPEQRKRIGYADVYDVLDAVARLSRA